MWIEKLVRKIKLYFDPPYERDCYYGDPFEFIIGKPLERVLHKMTTNTGDTLWETVPSDRCYRLTIESCSMPSYYRCTSEVLATSVNDPSDKKWLKRSQPRRILKEVFHQMIIDGRIERL